MVDEDVLEKTECTPITWKEGKNVTMKQTLKKQKNKWTGEIREVPRLVDWDSFFNIFKPLILPPPAEMEHLTKD